ncbi:MAG: carbohydrate ABC transporter substrate-binding protein [Lachnospiraceae bacterium]|jgi:multiple sugar transport system substrate-binding protein|nr:carbohydrate ABC transporter substrate-binding protein [Lachnospiraceae bacterium]MCH4069996.1 carbohydrate ABC transporter substrate-binding protein [Lachnospiraceae bacterium]MCH4108650.1 carbohydrate ABC transporter substrate-binding protein [Lachnospiraceae bacterium]MCI1302802.1 carbohydrate ABC transporter substrate-binding protein [Lachnospiraceae bacterium]MCI1332061.1 carbohydrate ABC transporter substrate-binding protein [Lachnospiraceae bacterium]
MKKQLGSVILSAACAASLLAGCGSTAQTTATSAASSVAKTAGTASTTAAAAGGDTIDVQFWSAPNQNQFDYWKTKAEAYNSQKHTVNGKSVQVTVTMIPETTSSEAAIQNALATGSAPAASENINDSFMAVLADSNAIYDIQDEDFYKQIMANKELDENVESTWEYNGKQYIIPVYINPICLNWNKKALDALGCDVPKTMDEFRNVIQKYVDNPDKMQELGVQFTTIQSNILKTSDYWNRNYDFLMVYDALGGGKLYEGKKFSVDAGIAKDAFEFWGQLGNTICLDEITNIWNADQVPELFGFGYPWELSSYTDAGKVYDQDYVFGPTIVKRSGDKPAYYSDSKGIAFYKASNITDDQHSGAVDFISWVYSKDNCAKSDADWLKATSMLPVRGDINSNDEFSSMLQQMPALKFLADAIPNAVPGPVIANSSDAYIALGESGLAPYIQKAAGMQPLQAPDATQYVSAGLEAMKAAAGAQ